MLPQSQTLFPDCFQRRTRIRSLFIRRNQFSNRPEQLSLFPINNADQQHTLSSQDESTLWLDRLQSLLCLKKISWRRSKLSNPRNSINQ